MKYIVDIESIGVNIEFGIETFSEPEEFYSMTKFLYDELEKSPYVVTAYESYVWEAIVVNFAIKDKQGDKVEYVELVNWIESILDMWEKP
jgi:hypothetical protein